MLKNKWKREYGKVRGAYAETDYDKKAIRIDKSKHKHKQKSLYGIPKKDSTIINSIVHEELHRKHPKMHEKTVRKETRSIVANMSDKSKAKLRSKYK